MVASRASFASMNCGKVRSGGVHVRWTTVEAVERRWRARACSELEYSPCRSEFTIHLLSSTRMFSRAILLHCGGLREPYVVEGCAWVSGGGAEGGGTEAAFARAASLSSVGRS